MKGSAFDPDAISRKGHDGVLGDLLPRLHYLDLEAFAALGDRVTPEILPPWV